MLEDETLQRFRPDGNLSHPPELISVVVDTTCLDFQRGDTCHVQDSGEVTSLEMKRVCSHEQLVVRSWVRGAEGMQIYARESGELNALYTGYGDGQVTRMG